ncbi:hypothetical protein BU23DRAFT_123558 [Bimuria novae-zelandiae CBS 107.79]|uniref:Uncharacterized protein n=1 Tax=Bimuria novae-zelandiae CBS 107.79 TaxID=1447943 RepID=A0A6A5UG59_9PLEO|nr:hypothetical protein BU23DRAFT_123558 [Bimuria novae-zelandiae CBS 107.79]
MDGALQQLRAINAESHHLVCKPLHICRHLRNEENAAVASAAVLKNAKGNTSEGGEMGIKINYQGELILRSNHSTILSPSSLE